MQQQSAVSYKSWPLLSRPSFQHLKKVPLFNQKVAAGFPSPADDYLEIKLNLNDYLIKHPASTFFLRADGNELNQWGIFCGDLLIVDRSISPNAGKTVVVVLDGELKVRRLLRYGGLLYLNGRNLKQATELKEEDVIWGVVTHVIHALL
jgi:DNA polymerase V